jgi:hypothetical protein
MSFIVIAPAGWTLGPRVERKFAVTQSQEESRPHPEPLAGKKTGNQSEPWLPPAGCAAAIPEPGSASVALEGSLDSPPAQVRAGNHPKPAKTGRFVCVASATNKRS